MEVTIMAATKSKRFNFTQTSLAALKIPDKRTWVYDTKVPQLGLTLLPSGTRSFHVRATDYGQTKRIALVNGRYPGMKVEQARKEASRVLAQIADKADPVEARKEKKVSETTLREVFNDYFEKKRTGTGDRLRESTKAEYEMALDKTVADYWDRPLSDLDDEKLILRVYRKRQDESKTRAASFHKVITALFNFARLNYKRSSGESYFPNNPGQVIVDHRLRYRVPRRKTYIAEEEMADWFDAVEALGSVEREFLLFILDDRRPEIGGTTAEVGRCGPAYRHIHADRNKEPEGRDTPDPVLPSAAAKKAQGEGQGGRAGYFPWAMMPGPVSGRSGRQAGCNLPCMI
jgi:hypothetical protein